MPLYFAYGSNMDRAAMRHRCPGARLIGQASLDDHRFFIALCGYASIRFEPEAQVLGLLWDLQDADVAALDDYEDVAGGLYAKEVRDVAVQEAAGLSMTRKALMYRVRNDKPGRPLPGYLEDILAEARDLGFPEAYLKDLARWRR